MARNLYMYTFKDGKITTAKHEVSNQNANYYRKTDGYFDYIHTKLMCMKDEGIVESHDKASVLTVFFTRPSFRKAKDAFIKYYEKKIDRSRREIETAHRRIERCERLINIVEDAKENV